jgi:hypothetical protein
MGAVSYWFLGVFNLRFNINTFTGIFMQGLLSGLIGIVVHVMLLSILKNKELKVISTTLKHKIWKAKIIPADPSGV